MAVMHKKGVFFTLSALLLLSLVFADLLFEAAPHADQADKIVRVKTATLNSFVNNLDEDIARGLFIAGFRSLIAANQHISEKNEFLDDTEGSLIEAMLNGTIEGKTAGIMDQSTLTEWTGRIRAQALTVGILVNFSFILDINQSSPWQIDFYSNVSYNVTDTSSTASFRRNVFIESSAELAGLKDPVYTIYTQGKVLRTINITPYEGNYVSGANTENLIGHINALYYANSSGPSYLMRLEGNLNDSEFGIESIVVLPDLQEQGLPVYERSSVDYVYFGNENPEIYVINGTFEDWFRLDAEHLEKYQAEDIAK
ncbi:hypothetical protein HYX10_00105 [Candidatus Woesearchaeota archaeon]|nr:hypothetical protein [Candidatus Woesearchaeota archaeon]